jgi:cytochrome c peroxidase
MKTVLRYASIIVALVGCREQVLSIDDQIASLPLETLPEVIHPANNPPSEPKRILGQYLFNDPIMSGEKDVACVTCHLPNAGYADGLDLSIGVRGVGQGPNRINNSNGLIPLLSRNSPTIVNVAYNGLISRTQNYDPLLAPMFWDGRRKSLETQCVGPPTVFNIMRGDGYAALATYDSIIARLKHIPEYVSLFSDAFGPNSITKENIVKAIAAFERTIISKNSPYDLYVRGDNSALSEIQKAGLQLFYGKGNCATCHSGPMFSDYNYYNLGIAYNEKNPTPDKGVGSKFLFRTPTLRNVSLTAPYMHNGVLLTLADVLNHYNLGTSANDESGTIEAKVQALELNEDEIGAIISFLDGLTDDSYDKEILTRVPSGLNPGGN